MARLGTCGGLQVVQVRESGDSHSFGSRGFIYQRTLSGQVSWVTNCSEEDLRTSSRRVKGAKPPSLKDIHRGAVEEEGGSVVAKLSRTWTPTDT